MRIVSGLSLLSLAAFVAVLGAQCSNGNCPTPVIIPAAPQTILPTQPGYVWHNFVRTHGAIYLYRGQQQLGALNVASGVYRPLLDYAGNIWGDPCDPPVMPPVGYSYQPAAIGHGHSEPNYGVDRSKLRPVVEDTYKLTTPNGTKTLQRSEAHDVITNGVPDDSGKLRLTVIGSDAERDGALAELNAAHNADLKAQMNVWSVRPDHWSLKDNATGQPLYVTTGHPTIYLQAADGKVLHRQDDYRPGDLQAIRKAAGYDPKKDPDVRKGPAPFAGANLPLPLLGGGAIGLACLAFAQRRRRLA